MRKKRAYVLFTHHFQVSKQYKGKHEAFELCEFLEYLKPRHIDSTTAIIELTEQKMVKNRVGTLSFEDYIEYLYKSYPDKMKAVIELLALTEEYKKYSEEFLTQEIEVNTTETNEIPLGEVVEQPVPIETIQDGREIAIELEKFEVEQKIQNENQ